MHRLLCKWDCMGSTDTGYMEAIWGILQLVLQYGAGININQILFVDILHSTNTRDWIMGFFSGDSWNMRITGLNFENSMFALVVCLGAALEKKKIWKFILFATAVLSLSRTGWVMVASYVLIVTIRKLKRNLKIKTSALVRNAIGGVTVIAASLAAYLKIPSIRRQVSNILLRITDTDAINVS